MSSVQFCLPGGETGPLGPTHSQPSCLCFLLYVALLEGSLGLRCWVSLLCHPRSAGTMTLSPVPTWASLSFLTYLFSLGCLPP